MALSLNKAIATPMGKGHRSGPSGVPTIPKPPVPQVATRKTGRSRPAEQTAKAQLSEWLEPAQSALLYTGLGLGAYGLAQVEKKFHAARFLWAAGQDQGQVMVQTRLDLPAGSPLFPGETYVVNEVLDDGYVVLQPLLSREYVVAANSSLPPGVCLRAEQVLAMAESWHHKGSSK